MNCCVFNCSPIHLLVCLHVRQMCIVSTERAYWPSAVTNVFTIIIDAAEMNPSGWAGWEHSGTIIFRFPTNSHRYFWWTFQKWCFNLFLAILCSAQYRAWIKNGFPFSEVDNFRIEWDLIQNTKAKSYTPWVARWNCLSLFIKSRLIFQYTRENCFIYSHLFGEKVPKKLFTSRWRRETKHRRTYFLSVCVRVALFDGFYCYFANSTFPAISYMCVRSVWRKKERLSHFNDAIFMLSTKRSTRT